MELLDGADLNHVVEVGGPQSEARTAHILAAIAGALREAHDVGLIHRDIKPSNIMLCTQGGIRDTPKLLDFGLVRDVADADDGSTQDAVVGTPLYMSPEAISDPDKIDARSDLYALGAVGYYLLTGTDVFTGSSAIDVCRKHLDVAPEPPSARLGHPIEPSLEALVLDCLAKDPAGRPSDAAELARRLELCTGVGRWDADDACAWWREHGPALAERNAARQAGGGLRTLEVAPRRRT